MIMCCMNCVICMLGEYHRRKRSTLGSRKYNLRCSRIFWQNGLELNQKKNIIFWTVVPVLNINRLHCETLENFSSFCTRKGLKFNS